WTRDYGPIFVRDSAGVAAVKFRFNAWAKYRDWRSDNQVPARIAHLLELRIFEAEINGRPFVLEGGSIDVNGCGTLLTTEECLLSDVQARNPSTSRGQLEQALFAYLGVSNLIWLERGIAGDDTHGHVDDIARFVAPSRVLAAVERNTKDENHAPLA